MIVSPLDRVDCTLEVDCLRFDVSLLVGSLFEKKFAVGFSSIVYRSRLFRGGAQCKLWSVRRQRLFGFVRLPVLLIDYRLR